MTHQPHPSLAQLTAFDQGELPAPDWQRVEAHVAACTACCAQLETVVDGVLVQRLRVAARAALESSSPGSSTGAVQRHEATADEIPAELRNHRRYRVVEVLGAGGMGTVFRAEHELMARSVALKVLSSRLTRRPELVDRFRQEVQAAARLAHPNIVTAFDAEQAGDLHFLVMEFVPGQRVDTLLGAGPLPIAQACDIARQVALGLQHAYERGMVHRDIKPQNLMRLPDGRVKILDFGLARFVSENLSVEALTQAGTVLGTPDYIAPEQARDARSADVRADLYSLGCTLYHLLTGQPPFPGGSILQKLLAHEDQTPRSLRALRADAPPALERLVARLLAKQPADRFATPAAVAEALRPWAEGETPAATTAMNKFRVWAWILAGVVALVCAGTLALVGVFGNFFGAIEGEPGANEGRQNVADTHAVTPLVGHTDAIIRIAMSPDGKHAASVGVEPDVFVWDLTTGKLQRRLTGHRDQVRSVAYSSDGARLVSASADGRVGLWNLATGDNIKFLSAHSDTVQAVAFSPSGTEAASGGYDHEIKLWNLADGTVAKTLSGHTDCVTAVAYLPGGRELASTSYDGKLLVWSLETAQPVQSYAHEHGLMGLALSRSGRFALTACYNHKLYLWDLEKKARVREFAGHTEPVLDVSLSPNGLHGLSASKDGTVRLWEVATGAEIDTFRRHTGEVLAVAFDTTGRRALSGDEHGTLFLWPAAFPRTANNPPRKP